MVEQLANFGETTLAEALDDSETGVDVTDGSVFPASGNFRVLVGDEIMLVTARSTNTLTVTRGAESTTAAAHDSGADIRAVLTAASLPAIIAENDGVIVAASDPGTPAASDALWIDTGSTPLPEALVTGTAFPASPTTGDRYRRSDIDYLVFFYDGTRWVSEQMLTYTMNGPDSSSTTDDAFERWPLPADYDIWLVKWDLFMRQSVAGASSWTLNLNIEDFEDDLTVIDSYTNAAPGDTNWRHWTRTLGSVVACAGSNSANESTHISLGFTENSGSEGLHAAIQVYYRFIAT